MARRPQDSYRTCSEESDQDSSKSIVFSVSDGEDPVTHLLKDCQEKAIVVESSDQDSDIGNSGGQDEDEESQIGFRRGYRQRKPIVIESSDESDNEDYNKYPLQSTLMPGHNPGLPFLSDEEILADEKRISEVCDNKPNGPASFLSDDDICISDEETYIKPRKSVRISLALGKLLNIDEDKALDQNDKCDTADMKDISSELFSEQVGHLIEQDAKQNLSSNIERNESLKQMKHCYSESEVVSQKGEGNEDKPLKNTSTEVLSVEDYHKEQEGTGIRVSSKSEQSVKDDAIKETEKQIQSVTLPDSVVCASPVKSEEVDCIDICDNEEDKLQFNDHVEKSGYLNPLSKTVINNSKFPEQSSSSDVQIIDIEDKLATLKVSDIRNYGEIKKPQITQSSHQLKCEIDNLNKEVMKLKRTVHSVDISLLPDKGMKLQMKLQESMYLLKMKERELAKLPASPNKEEAAQGKPVQPGINRLPIGFGVKALQTQIKEKTLTEEALSALHGSISTCPSENVMAEAPSGLRSSVELMPHQKHALAWLMWRETQKPPAGILADDMGLGKTLTMLSLILKVKEEKGTKDEKPCKDEDEDEDECDNKKYPLGGTLVVCPASLLMQWEDEVKKHCKRGVLEVEIHHGSKREENARYLAQNDIVITTYSIVRTSSTKGGKDESVNRSRRGVLHRIRWNRIILDEAHVVRNHKSQQSLAVCFLMGSKRWALTGTPIHNKELDLYALLKFLRCSPFDDYNVWRRWVDNKNTAGIKRLNTLINAIMLRRTKAVLQDKGELASLPEKTLTEISIALDKKEFDVYEKILWFSKTLFAQFLQQRADKEMSGLSLFSQPAYGKKAVNCVNPFQDNPELAKMFGKMQQMRDIKTHEILVLLLRLRQICVHPGLIKAMLDAEAKQAGGLDDTDGEKDDILTKMGSMSLTDTAHKDDDDDDDDGTENTLQISNPVFDFKRASSKMRAVFKVLQEKVFNTSDKAVIVSQWTSMLNILHEHLLDFGVKCDILSGAVPVKDRIDIVKKFNSEHGFQILLLSLTAGGVGLNLTGGNHLFLIDLHWNPQLESQAFDRIYRYGQKKPVFIYKFICQETIEERIKLLQNKKLTLATDVLSGTMSKNVNKLTLDDLKSLFSM